MANYNIKFSVAVKLPNEAAQSYALELAAEATGHFVSDEPLPCDFPESLLKACEKVTEDSVPWYFQTERDSEGIWLHSDYGAGDLEVASLFIQHLLQKFNPDGRVTFEWSRDCSKPRLDAYGGGTVIITAAAIRITSTGEWLRQQLAAGSEPPAP